MASDYSEYLKKRGYLRLILRRIFLRPIVAFFSGRVLDIGSGIGEFLHIYPDSVGVDINKECVTFCLSKGYRCVDGDIYDLPFPPDSFDGVLLNNVLEHLEDANKALKEVSRVLRYGGKLAIELPGKKGFMHDKTHVKFWDRNNSSELLAKWSFEIQRESFFPLPFRWAGDFFTHNKLRLFAINRKKI